MQRGIPLASGSPGVGGGDELDEGGVEGELDRVRVDGARDVDATGTGGGSTLRERGAGIGSARFPRPYDRPAFSSRPSMFLKSNFSESSRKGQKGNALRVDAEELAVVVERLEEPVERGRRRLVRHRLELGYHRVEDGRVGFRL